MASRDTIMTDDFVCINLDTFNDQQSLYAFYVNPLGIQGDSRFASNQEDFSVDFVWYERRPARPRTATRSRSAIPFKSIRYAGQARVEMAHLLRAPRSAAAPSTAPIPGSTRPRAMPS